MNPDDETRRAWRIAALAAGAQLASLAVLLIAEEVLRARLRPFRGFAGLENVQFARYLAYGLGILQILLIRGLRTVLLKKPSGASPAICRQRLTQASIVSLALAEIPALLGFLLFLLAGLALDFYVLLFVSLVLMFMYFPRLSAWEDWIRE